MVQEQSHMRFLSVCEKIPEERSMNLLILVSPKQGIVVGMCFMLLPGTVDRSELTKENLLQ